MAFMGLSLLGLPHGCYVFPRYENACAAHDLWRSVRRSRGKQCRALCLLVSLCALAPPIFPSS